MPTPSRQLRSQRPVERTVCSLAEEYLSGLRAVVLNGPRQAGKTTILRQLHAAHGGTFLNLDDEATLAVVRHDPRGITGDADAPVIIDEVQRVGDPLILAVKVRVDTSKARGQFILAGSLRFLSVPGITESLAGRAGVLEVWPFSQGEIDGITERFIDIAFTDAGRLRRLPPSNLTRRDYFERICAGGYPEPLAIASPRVRASWYDGYLTNVIERDLREVARIREDSAAESILRYLAATTAQELNTTALSNKTGYSAKTVRRYLDLLRTAFLIHRIPAWSRNVTAKVVKHPKIHLTDTGVAAHLLSLSAAALARPVSPSRGALLETFVVNELAKQRVWSDTDARIHHWRDRSGLEVDIVLQAGDGRVVGVECKAADSVNMADFRGLAALRDNLGDDFTHGYLLHTGPQALSFGDRLTLLPVSALWHDYS